MLYTTQEAWEDRLLQLANKPFNEALISTFNLYLGSPKVEEALVKLNASGKAKVLVGVPNYSPCCEWKEGPCPPCTKNRARLLDRITQATVKYPKIQWNYTYDWHLKTYMFRIGNLWVGLFGGVNLSASSWTDALIDLYGKDAKELVGIVKERLDTSPLITKEALAIDGYRKRA